MVKFLRVSFVIILLGTTGGSFAIGQAESHPDRRTGRVRVEDHCLVDDDGPFLGLGASYMTALHRYKYDTERFDRDMAFLKAQGFQYVRILSMVGWNASWNDLEIAPVSFVTREGKHVDAWPDYWKQISGMVDRAFDHHGMRVEITIFADAQLMPEKPARLEHMRRLLAEVVAGREQKILMLEVANEAWQNGFPGPEGVADLREFSRYLNERTEVPVAISSNHAESFVELYRDSGADLATWHFSRDTRTDDGWMPVYDCWSIADVAGCPPVVSNEPIGPGSSVARETEPIRLVMAAAFAYAAKLPSYVFHCGAGVMGRDARFEDTPGINRFRPMIALLPSDLPNWTRNDGKEAAAPLTVFANGAADRYCSDGDGSPDGCVRNTGSRRGDRFVCLPIGIRPGGLTLQARQPVQFQVMDPLTGNEVLSKTLSTGDRLTLPNGPGAYIILGRLTSTD
jgi:hypothetical protein